jgi:hypothetical protein
LSEPVHFEEKTFTNERENDHESMVINEVRLLFAEKRTLLEARQFSQGDPWA